MKVAIIGFGRAGRMHLDAMRLAFEIETVAVCDPAPERRAEAGRLGLRSYAHLSTLLACDEIDAAVICTPPRDHLAAAVECLSRGVHVLCEKPMALCAQDAREMFAAANGDVLLAVASKFRHVPEVRRVRSMMADGHLGEPTGFNISFQTLADMSACWRAQTEHSGGGVIADNSPHAFDIVSYLFGEVVAVQAISQPPTQALPVEDSARLEIETRAAVPGTIDLSWSRHASGDVYLTLECTRATVAIGWKRSLIKHGSGSWGVLGGPYDRNKAHCDMHNAFRAALSDGHDLWITPRECLQGVAAVEASYRSLLNGRKETLSPTRAPENLAESNCRQAVMS